MAVLEKINRLVSTLLTALLTIILLLTVIDGLFFDSNHIINPSLSVAQKNSTSLSVIFSFLLFVAYILQYQTQQRQMEIMNRQEGIMEAGYSPILGVTSREWGYDRAEIEERNTIKPGDANELFLKIQNNGNSTARDLRLWFGIKSKNLPVDTVLPDTTPLRRTDSGSWWPPDTGGAISSEEGDVEFSASPKLARHKNWGPLQKLRGSGPTEEADPHDIFKDLQENNVEEVMIGIELQYTTSTGAADAIPLGVFKLTLEDCSEEELYIYKAMDWDDTELEEIKEYNRKKTHLL